MGTSNKRETMRRLARGMGWIGALALGLAAIWLAGAVVMGQAAEGGFAALRDGGWQIDAEAPQTRGFPLRLVTEFRALRAVSPRGDVIVQAPAMLIAQQLTQPGRIEIAPTPESALLILPYRLVAAETAVTLSARPLPPFELRSVRFDLEELLASADGLASMALSRGQLDVEALDAPDRYALRLDLEGAALPDLAAPPARAVLDAELTLSAPLSALGNAPDLRDITVHELHLNWVQADLTGSGHLTVAANGTLEGRLEFRLEGWHNYLDQAQAAGFLSPPGRARLELRGGLLAALSDDPDVIEAPLVLENGRMFLGPFPLGPAPQLY